MQPTVPKLVQFRVNANGLGIDCRVWPGTGSRMPLVLLHGLTGSSRDWCAIAPRLATRRTVYAWDARGHGGSDWSADAAYDGDAHFADLVGVLDVLAIERCALVGYSMGGGIAILAAGAIPERIARLIVIDSYPSPEMSSGSRRIAEAIAETAESVVAPTFDPAIARSMAAQLADNDPRRLDLWPFWDAGEQPAVVVRGEASDVLLPEMAEEMLRRRPSRLVTIPGVAHAIPALRPRYLTRILDSFLGDD